MKETFKLVSATAYVVQMSAVLGLFEAFKKGMDEEIKTLIQEDLNEAQVGLEKVHEMLVAHSLDCSTELDQAIAELKEGGG